MGWGLIASAQGKGYALEGVTAALDYVFDVVGWDEAIHCIHKDNAASIRLAERLGSSRRRENVPLPPPVDAIVDIYGQTKGEWRRHRPARLAR